MSKIGFKNEYFLTEKHEDGTRVVNVLKDDDNFFGISLEGCKFITNSKGFIADEFTDLALEQIKIYCENSENLKTEMEFKLELRNRKLNRLIGML